MPATSPEPSVHIATRDDFDQVVDALCDAFFDYPVMRFVIGPVGDEYSHRLRHLIGFFSQARLLRDEPVLVAREESRILGVADLARPEVPPPPELEVVRERLWDELGPAARARYEEFGETIAPFFPAATARLHLMMLGVRREAAGRGLGRRLLEAVHRLSADDPDSTGVSLTTETGENVPFYERFGYRVVARAQIGGLFDSWGMFRPNAVTGTSAPTGRPRRRGP